MRARYFGIFILGSTVAAGACTRPSTMNKDKSKVSIDLACTNGGISAYKVDPYVSEIADRTKHFTWTLTGNDDVVQAIIIPKGANPWPFVETSYVVLKGKSENSKTLKDSIPEGTYKYSIGAVCKNGSKQDTVTIDPDMIIPKGNLN